MARLESNYLNELHERAVGMFTEIRKDYTSDWATATSIADKLDITSTQTVLNWVRKAQVDPGTRPGIPSDAAADIRKLRAENRELKRANEMLKAASVFFAAELDRPRK